MGGCICKPETVAPPWPDLPPEIAGRILCRLPSHDDRRSFGAVCSRWRLAARQQSPLPPAMPCINLGRGAYQSLAGGKVRRFPTPKGYRAGGTFGGWLFCYSQRSGRCFLRAPFAGAIEVAARYRKSRVDFQTAMAWASRELPHSVLVGRGTDVKMVVCSSDLVVALFHHPDHANFRPVSYLASFRPAAQQLRRLLVWSFAVQPHDRHPRYVYTDIVFYHGKLFALSSWEELFCHELFPVADDNNNVDMNHHHLLPVVDHDMEARPTRVTDSYLVVSSDKQKLLMMRWRRRDHELAIDLSVFEADFARARWLAVKDLGDQVLFLGRSCSMAFAAGSSEHWGRRNRVFVLGTEWARSGRRQPVPYKDIPSYCVYDMASGKTILSLERPRYMESCTSGWFFP